MREFWNKNKVYVIVAVCVVALFVLWSSGKASSWYDTAVGTNTNSVNEEQDVSPVKSIPSSFKDKVAVPPSHETPVEKELNELPVQGDIPTPLNKTTEPQIPFNTGEAVQ